MDHLITYIYTGNGSMKIIFEPSEQVKTSPCFHSMHGQKLGKKSSRYSLDIAVWIDAFLGFITEWEHSLVA